MTASHRFRIRIEEAHTSWDAPRPDDPVGELTRFELGFAQFCHAQNHRVSIGVDDEVVSIFLFPDISLAIGELAEALRTLSQQRTATIVFGESQLVVEFHPTPQSCRCIVEKVGYSRTRNEFDVDTQQVMHELRAFIEDTLTRAANENYISRQDAGEFLDAM